MGKKSASPRHSGLSISGNTYIDVANSDSASHFVGVERGWSSAAVVVGSLKVMIKACRRDCASVWVTALFFWLPLALGFTALVGSWSM